jgi:hypothetical protein
LGGCTAVATTLYGMRDLSKIDQVLYENQMRVTVWVMDIWLETTSILLQPMHI